MLTFEPLVAPALWAALAALGLALLAWYGWSRPDELSRGRWAGIVALMFTGLALVFIILLNPTWVERIPPPAGKPRLTLLVDASASMNTADSPGGESRYQEASTLAGGLARKLTGEFDVQTQLFSATAAPIEAEALAGIHPNAASTDLAAAINSATQDDRPQGQAIVLISDGIHNVAGTPPVLDAARLAKAMAAPIYTKTLGGQTDVRDMRVEWEEPQQLAFAGQRLWAGTRISHQGMAGAHTSVVLIENGKELSRKEITLPPEGEATVQFEIMRPEKGLFRYEVKAEPIAGEASPGNNQATMSLRVLDEPIHILVLEGKPYWDGKFLMRTLAADPLAELDSVVRLTSGRIIQQTVTSQRSSPTTQPVRTRQWKVITDPTLVLSKPELLRTYQVIVLGRDSDVFLNETCLNNLREWISREGGALLCYRGSPMPEVAGRLASVLPVEWTAGREARFHVKLTERGRDLRWLPGGAGTNAIADLTELPTLATVSPVGRTKPLASVLATAVFAEGGPETPVVSFQPYGTGRSVVVEGAGMWRWAFLPPEQQEHDALYGTLWHSLLRWLVTGGGLLPGQKSALRADKVCFNENEVAAATLQLRETPGASLPQIELVTEGRQGKRSFSGSAIKDESGTYRVIFGKLPSGRYRVQTAGAADPGSATQAFFDVVGSLDETLELHARPDLMARIAADSGGAVLVDASVDEVTRRFHEHSEANRPVRTRRSTAWDRWWVLTALLGVWSSAWALRRSGGLV